MTITHPLGPIDAFETGTASKVTVGEHAVAIVRIGDDLYAIADRCSHAEASLSEGEVFENEIECPRHGAVFDVTTGAALTLPATKPVDTYEIVIDGGEASLIITETDSA